MSKTRSCVWCYLPVDNLLPMAFRRSCVEPEQWYGPFTPYLCSSVCTRKWERLRAEVLPELDD